MDPDQVAPEPLLISVHDPSRVDFADLLHKPKSVRVDFEMLQMGEASFVTTRQQPFGDDRLRLNVDDLGPIVGIDVPSSGWNEA
jgi:hypothetical protein